MLHHRTSVCELHEERQRTLTTVMCGDAWLMRPLPRSHTTDPARLNHGAGHSAALLLPSEGTAAPRQTHEVRRRREQGDGVNGLQGATAWHQVACWTCRTKALAK